MIHNEPQKFLIEKWVSGILTKPQAEDLESHIHVCKACEEYHQDLIHQKQSFLLKYPYEKFAKNSQIQAIQHPIHVILEPFKHFFQNLSKPQWASAVAALVLVAILTPFILLVPNESTGTNIVYKGSHKLEALLIQENQPLPLEFGKKVKNGSTIQFLFNNTKYTHMTLFSLDPNGKLSTYYQGITCCSYPLDKGVRQSYPHSVILDNTPQFEIFVGIFSKTPIDAQFLKVFEKEGKYLTDKIKQQLYIESFSKSNIKDLQKIAQKTYSSQPKNPKADLEVFLVRKE